MRGFIRFLRKQHFWLIVPVLVILMIVGWYSASSQAIDAFEEGASKIDSQFGSMQSVANESPHPNDAFHTGMEELIKTRALDVDAAWAAQYEKQVSTMKWSSSLSKDFVDQVDGLRPIESVDSTKKVPEWILNTYRDYIIEEELKRLASIIDSKWVVVEGDTMAMGGMGGYGAGYGAAGGAAGGDEAAAAPGAYGAGGDGGGYGGVVTAEAMVAGTAVPVAMA